MAESRELSVTVMPLESAASDPVLWTVLLAGACCAVGLGFVAGLLAAPILQEWSLRRAARHVRRMCELTQAELERAARVCQLLSQTSTSTFAADQWQRLQTARQSLHDAWEQVAARHAAMDADASKHLVDGPPLKLDWTRSPVEPVTQLPDRTAFDSNLERMIEAATQHHQCCGVLFVRVDRSDQLSSRYGNDALHALQAKVASMVIRSTRDEDLVCRLAHDLFGVLLPGTPPLAGIRAAEMIRSAVRDHAFHLDGQGPGILVTASFGYASAMPGDPASLVTDRATDALQRSQSVGRNQLHAHDTESRQLSRVG